MKNNDMPAGAAGATRPRGVEHVLASASLVPSFSPTIIDGRALVDGGFAANAPLEPFLSGERRGADWPLANLLDLFTPESGPPNSLEAALALGTDFQVTMQTRMRLNGLVRERALEARLEPDRRGTDLFHLSYRPLPHEAGSEKSFDFSSASISDRMAAGRRDAEALLARLPGAGPHPQGCGSIGSRERTGRASVSGGARPRPAHPSRPPDCRGPTCGS